MTISFNDWAELHRKIDQLDRKIELLIEILTEQEETEEERTELTAEEKQPIHPDVQRIIDNRKPRLRPLGEQ